MPARYDIANPNPGALVESLRSVGYSLPTAIADILDNSVTAGALNVWIEFDWKGGESEIRILDDGRGMTEAVLVDAMRPGSTSPTAPRSGSDLGRFGLGLKTASFSQCRRLSVWSRSLGTALAGRQWDLDYVVANNEWRLLKDFPPSNSGAFSRLGEFEQGTLVVWECIDRLVGNDDSSDGDAHERFLRHVRDTQEYLSMIFHRHLAGQTRNQRNALNIFVNGGPLRPWNPFDVSSSTRSESTPVEPISYNGQIIQVQGFVLPHKDRITETEFESGGGPRGWIAQQGYYIYRNDRMLLAGDWLRLGRGGRLWAKEEQYKLARLAIDIGNAMDLDWSLDVKKSTARPPAALRERLTGLAEHVRKMAKEVFLYRGAHGARPFQPGLQTFERPWRTRTRNGHTFYEIHRGHPLIRGVLERLGPLREEVEVAFRLIEETVPVERIWIDVAESEADHGIPYQGLSEGQVLADIRKLYGYLRNANMSQESAIAYLLASEPFNRYPDLVATLRERG